MEKPCSEQIKAAISVLEQIECKTKQQYFHLMLLSVVQTRSAETLTQNDKLKATEIVKIYANNHSQKPLREIKRSETSKAKNLFCLDNCLID